MLELCNLSIKISDHKTLFNDINLTIPRGETHVMFGPNGIGKSTLLRTIMGLPPGRVVKGDILVDGESILDLSIDERAKKKGIAMTFQRPPEINGIKLGDFVKIFSKNSKAEFMDQAKELKLQSMLDRDLNSGFSGGELKRSELYQVMAQKAEFIMIDEPESGVDLENMKLLGKTINHVLQRDSRVNYPRRVSSLIVTHTGYILDYINAEKGYVINNDGIFCEGNPREIFQHITENGFDRCETCAKAIGRGGCSDE
ncbi:MAG: ABC transporter ATP-binding protein [Candidatus Hodarchaeales archaeon]